MHEGVTFTDEDVDPCAAWLHRHGLIDGVIVDKFNGPVLSYLTDRGIHCADRFGADIRGYVDAMEQPRQSGPTFNVNATNVQLANGRPVPPDHDG